MNPYTDEKEKIHHPDEIKQKKIIVIKEIIKIIKIIKQK